MERRPSNLDDLIKIHDSILIVTAAQSLTKRITKLNKLFKTALNNLFRAALDGNKDDTIENIQKAKNILLTVAEKTWAKLETIYPYATINPITRWRLFNDDYATKKSLLDTHRDRAVVIIPCIDEIGMFTTVIKHAGLLAVKARYSGDIYMASILGEIKNELIQAMDEVISLLSKINQTNLQNQNTETKENFKTSSITSQVTASISQINNPSSQIYQSEKTKEQTEMSSQKTESSSTQEKITEKNLQDILKSLSSIKIST